MKTISDRIKATGLEYAFGVQAGDAMENPQIYDDWAGILDVFSSNFADTDILHVIGNHELFGDAYGTNVSTIFNLPALDYYSAEYGEVYVATIAYTESRSDLAEALAWLVEDAKASDCTWKILVMHQPAYYTNITGGNEFINAAVPDAVEEAGINAVFSGHDHSYARTNQLTDDQIDTEDGILYYICGSTGEKAYSISSQSVFDYDTIFAQATQNYGAIYITVEADKDHMTINTNDLDADAPIDTYTLYSKCYKNGHKYVYDPATKTVKCTVCGDTQEKYTGFIDDADGNTYYLTLGNPMKGWRAIGEDMCYFDTNGVQLEVTNIDDVPTTCTVQGHYTLQASNGATVTYNYGKAPGHEYEEQADGSYKCSVCGHTRIELSDCTVTIPYTMATYSGIAKRPYPTVTAPDGTVLTGHSVDYYVNWSDNTEVGTASVTITAKSGYYVNLKEYRGDYGGSVTVTFQIRPDLPTDVIAEYNSDGSIKVSWTAAKSAQNYTVYYSTDGTKWRTAGTTTDTSYNFTGAKAGTDYYFRIRTSSEVNGETYKSIKYTDPVEVGHLIVIDEAVAPTCTETGLTEGSHCAGCGEIIVAQEVIPALGHTWDEGVVTKEATAEEQGEITYTCQVCGETKVEYFAYDSVKGISLDVESLDMVTTESAQLTATVAPEEAANKNVIWTSSDESVATVDENGVVTAQRFGTATITATTEEGGYSASATVNIKFYDAVEGYQPDADSEAITANIAGAIDWMAEEGITKGFDRVYFGSYESITRSDFTIFLWRYAGSPEASGKATGFTDVDGVLNTSSDRFKAIKWAVSEGIINGYKADNGTKYFDVDGSITRSQIAVMLWKYSDKPEVTGEAKAFGDVAVGEYDLTENMVKAINWASSEGLVNGYTTGEYAGMFRPQDDCMRYQMAIILSRYNAKFGE